VNAGPVGRIADAVAGKNGLALRNPRALDRRQQAP
jgi:hypothetical protein